MKKHLLLLPVAALVLSAGSCAPHVEFPKPPADKLVCDDEPGKPEKPITDEKNGAYLKAMRGAWGSCKSDVDWMRAWFKELAR